jgi:hypothetical protein
VPVGGAQAPLEVERGEAAGQLGLERVAAPLELVHLSALRRHGKTQPHRRQLLELLLELGPVTGAQRRPLCAGRLERDRLAPQDEVERAPGDARVARERAQGERERHVDVALRALAQLDAGPVRAHRQQLGDDRVVDRARLEGELERLGVRAGVQPALEQVAEQRGKVGMALGQRSPGDRERLREARLGVGEPAAVEVQAAELVERDREPRMGRAERAVGGDRPLEHGLGLRRLAAGVQDGAEPEQALGPLLGRRRLAQRERLAVGRLGPREVAEAEEALAHAEQRRRERPRVVAVPAPGLQDREVERQRLPHAAGVAVALGEGVPRGGRLGVI